MLPVIVRIMVTGVLAIVPSKSNPDLTRIIVPNLMQVADTHKGVPAHFAYLQVNSRNLDMDPPETSPPVKLTRPVKLKFHADKEPLDDNDQWVFALRSEEVSIDPPPANQTLKPKAAMEGDLESTFYELKMEYLCKCSPIAKEYFAPLSDANEAKIAARMDLIGGRESVDGVDPHEVWDLPGKDHDRSYAERVVYEFDVPGETATLKIKSISGTFTQITLKPDPKVSKGRIDVILGNAPVQAIVAPLDNIVRSTHTEGHFKLLYEILQSRPWRRRVPKLKHTNSTPVVGLHDNCKTGGFVAQDGDQ